MKNYMRFIKIVILVVVLGVVALFAGIQYLLSQPAPEGFPILEYHMVQEKNQDKVYD